MKHCDECVSTAYCSYDGICWIDERTREERAQQERTRTNAQRKHSVEKALKAKGRRHK